MTAAQTAQALGLDAHAVAAFTGSPSEFAQHFGVDRTEAPGGGGGGGGSAIPTDFTIVAGVGNMRTATWKNPSPPNPAIASWVIHVVTPGQGYDNVYPNTGMGDSPLAPTAESYDFSREFVPVGPKDAYLVGLAADGTTEVVRSATTTCP